MLQRNKKKFDIGEEVIYAVVGDLFDGKDPLSGKKGTVVANRTADTRDIQFSDITRTININNLISCSV